MDFQAIINLIQILALTIISGGTLVLGALVAPLLFNQLSREEASAIMIELFGNFDTWIKFSALSVLGAKLIEVVLINKFNFFISTTSGEEVKQVFNSALLNSSLLAIAIAAISLHIVYKLSPAILESYENDSMQFAALHKQSEILHRVNFVLGLLLLAHFS